MTWRVEMGDAVPMVAEVLGAQVAWKKLTKPAQEALEAAYPDGPVEAHTNTMNALLRHGFIEQGLVSWFLTDAGKSVAKWSVKP